jgi:predicted transcriptional regulator
MMAKETVPVTLRWQIQHVKQGLREAEAGKFVREKDVKKMLARLRHK